MVSILLRQHGPQVLMPSKLSQQDDRGGEEAPPGHLVISGEHLWSGGSPEPGGHHHLQLDRCPPRGPVSLAALCSGSPPSGGEHCQRSPQIEAELLIS
jgi:hypothetical protein